MMSVVHIARKGEMIRRSPRSQHRNERRHRHGHGEDERHRKQEYLDNDATGQPLIEERWQTLHDLIEQHR
jgi:hypothetical protein